MNLDRLIRKFHALLVLTPILIMLNQDVFGMNATTAINLGGTGEGFGIVQVGGHDYGENSLGVWLSGNIRIGLSDTISDDFSGIGIFDARLSPDDMKIAKEIHSKLCKAVESGPAHEVRVVEPSPIYDVDCIQDGKLINKSAKMYELPQELFDLIHRFNSSMTRYLPEARPVVKLDARIAGVKREKENFRVSIEFRNRGPYAISFRRPDDLEPDQGDRLNVQGSLAGGDVFLDANLAGMPLLNESEISGRPIITPMGKHVIYVTVAPYSSMNFEYNVSPKIKIPHGAYSFNLVAALDASAPDVAPSLGFVDFHSDYKNPYRVTFDRDYPSTPQEWKEFEARKAKEVSFLMPGATVAESGYYRAASIAGTRDQFARKFEQGTAAPDLDFQRWDRWEWEADLARATICKPGDTCPREGRWILRAKDYSYGSKGDLTYPQYQQRFRMGEQIPARDLANVDVSRLFWEWLSA